MYCKKIQLFRSFGERKMLMKMNSGWGNRIICGKVYPLSFPEQYFLYFPLTICKRWRKSYSFRDPFLFSVNDAGNYRLNHYFSGGLPSLKSNDGISFFMAQCAAFHIICLNDFAWNGCGVCPGRSAATRPRPAS